MPLPPVNVNDPSIPVLGEPVKMLSILVAPIFQCQCDAKTIMQPAGLGAIATCPACKRSYRLDILSVNVPTNQMQVGIGTVISAKEF